MQLGTDFFSRLARGMMTLLMGLAWAGAPQWARARDDAATQPASQPGARTPEQLQQAREQFERMLKAVEAADAKLQRDSFDPAAVVEKVGRDPDQLFAWVRDQTTWLPYRGELRGPVGVLMDRGGSSLDRALLLAELLRLAGQTARLAHAALPADRASEVLEKLRAAPVAAPPPDDLDVDVRDDIRTTSAEFGLDKDLLNRTQSRLQFTAGKKAEQLAGRVQDQLPALLQATGGVPAAAANDEKQMLAAIADHWWVQRMQGSQWIDLDPLSPASKPGEAMVGASQTLAPGANGQFSVPPEEIHTVRIRLLIEKRDAGKLSEISVLDQPLRPDQIYGRRVVLTHWPLNWPNTDAPPPEVDRRIRMITIEQHEWMPVMRVGSDQIIQSSFTDTCDVNRHPNPDPMARLGKTIGKLSGALDAFGGVQGDQPKSAAELTAEWVEYQISRPGEAPVVERRQVFDLIGPAARAGGSPANVDLTEPQRIERGLALLGGFEVLVVPCRLSAQYVQHLACAALLRNRNAMTGFFDPDWHPDTKALTNKLQSLSAMPGPLYSLALMRHMSGQDAGQLCYTSANVLTCRWAMRIDAAAEPSERVKLCEGFDIVNNSLSLRPQSKSSAYAARAEQGIIDTNAEALMMSPCAVVENTAEMFDLRRRSGGPWLTVRKGDDPAWKAAQIPPDVRARVDRDLAAGYVVVVPSTPVALHDHSSVGWWRIDPKSGQTLGMSDIGGGATMVEYALVVFSIVVCGGIAFSDGKLSAQDIIVCVGLGAGGAYLAVPLTLGKCIALVVVAAATGFWLSQSPYLQHGFGG